MKLCKVSLSPLQWSIEKVIFFLIYLLAKKKKMHRQDHAAFLQISVETSGDGIKENETRLLIAIPKAVFED